MRKIELIQSGGSPALALNCRAFDGKLAHNYVKVDEHGAVLVWDYVAHHYTTCHSLGRRDLLTIRRAWDEFVKKG
jgi:hypothetical protein